MSLLAASLLLAALADQPAGPPKFKIVDIVFKIEDLETEVRSLEVKETDTEVRIELAADVLFDFDKADILPKAEQTLAEAAELIGERGQGTVRIEGHTDSKGSDAYNRKLSQRRAESVKAWFLRQPGASEAEYRCRLRSQPAGGAEREDRRLGRPGRAPAEPARRDRPEEVGAASGSVCVRVESALRIPRDEPLGLSSPRSQGRSIGSGRATISTFN